MRYPYRSDWTMYLMPPVFLLVALFNLYRLGKLSKFQALALGVVVLAASVVLIPLIKP